VTWELSKDIQTLEKENILIRMGEKGNMYSPCVTHEFEREQQIIWAAYSSAIGNHNLSVWSGKYTWFLIPPSVQKE
jgi:hypothetical protein